MVVLDNSAARPEDYDLMNLYEESKPCGLGEIFLVGEETLGKSAIVLKSENMNVSGFLGS